MVSQVFLKENLGEILVQASLIHKPSQGITRRRDYIARLEVGLTKGQLGQEKKNYKEANFKRSRSGKHEREQNSSFKRAEGIDRSVTKGISKKPEHFRR
ncbi:hypothetical protein [Rufibacter sp. LB8]|uniref:hypothetical protein n=1 Tax=Rufibacter sp. LB8 TaxID=2777781 RepID=UPI00178C5EB9|nr:hypothetical protein [Rufibacter sp. LB8]